MFLALEGAPLVIVSIIAFILILGLIIVVHEAGHFIFARRAGILCHEFSLGMGPAIYKKKIGETTFCLRAIPIGGFVSMAGEEVEPDRIKVGSKIGLNILDGKVSELVLDESLDAMVSGEIVDFDLYGKDGLPLYITVNDGFQDRYYEVLKDAFYVFDANKKMQIAPYDRSFESKTLWQRFLTLFAGPCMNFILAIILYLIISFASGVPNYDSTVIGNVSDSGSAVEILQNGDEIKKVNGVGISSWNDLSRELDKLIENNLTTVTLEVSRNGEIHQLKIECSTYIASLGLSNLQAEKKDFPASVKNGVLIGNIALRYLDEGKKGEYPIASGDILTKIRIDHLQNGGVVPGEVQDITSWSQLIEIFKDANVSNVYFEYYSYKKEGIVSIEECAALQTYGDEVLTNQRIEKIQIKIGISPTNHFDFFGSIAACFENFWNDFTLIFRTLGLLIAPSGIRQVGVSDLSSFVGIFSLVEMFVGTGLLSLMSLAALLSVNIGVMNLLPIPALDGGRIVFLGYELVTRKKPSKRFENILNNIFFVLLMVLFVYVTFNDVMRLVRK